MLNKNQKINSYAISKNIFLREEIMYSNFQNRFLKNSKKINRDFVYPSGYALLSLV